MTKRLYLTFTLLVAALLIVVMPASAQSGNLLRDPGFEGDSYTRISTDPRDPNVTFNVPAFWGGGAVLEPYPPDWRNVHPTGFPHTGPIKWAGNRSFHMARGGGTFTAYIYQRVSVQPNTPVEGGAYAFIEGNTGMVRAGIDPNGGTNPFAEGVVWSPFSEARNTWSRPSVSATAGSSGAVTLFLFATQREPHDPNGVYWDEAFLNGIPGEGLPEAAPPPAAEPAQQVLTPTVRLNVRSGPGTNFDRLGVISPRDTFAVRGESGGWFIIDFNGQRGYVSGNFVNISEGQPSEAPGITPVSSLDFTVDYTLRLRTGPSTQTETLERIPFTAIVQAIGRTADNNWLQVNYAGQTGWVAARFGRLSGDINALPVRN